MKPELSIIIPCYNCEKTVEEAVNSCFTQSLTNFEIIMVNDGSVDNTKIILRKLAAKHDKIKIINHIQNMGGGAARNTGIKNSLGEYIYCLDSDNVLGENTLSKCLAYIQNHNCDGVAVHERRFFSNKIDKFSSIIKNSILDRPITLQDIFDGKNEIMIDNFLYSRKSYGKTLGYPEHHGFDTQSFEIRYLVAGNSIYVCPDTYSYHRQVELGRTSYFEREFNKGNFSINYYLIAEDMITILSDEAIKALIDFNIFKNNSLENSIVNLFKNLAKKGKLLESKNSQLKKIDALTEEFKKAIGNFKNKKITDSQNNLTKICSIYKKTEVLEYVIERNKIALQNKNLSGKELEKELSQWIIKNKKMPRYQLYRWYHKIPFISLIIKLYLKWKTKQTTA